MNRKTLRGYQSRLGMSLVAYQAGALLALAVDYAYQHLGRLHHPIKQLIKHKRISAYGTTFAASYLVFALYLLTRTITCNPDAYACGWSWFTISLPLYILLLSVLGSFSIGVHILAFAMTAFVYTSVFYSLGRGVEKLKILIQLKRQTA
jgi:hypothetical protein